MTKQELGATEWMCASRSPFFSWDSEMEVEAMRCTLTHFNERYHFDKDMYIDKTYRAMLDVLDSADQVVEALRQFENLNENIVKFDSVKDDDGDEHRTIIIQPTMLNVVREFLRGLTRLDVQDMFDNSMPSVWFKENKPIMKKLGVTKNVYAPLVNPVYNAFAYLTTEFYTKIRDAFKPVESMIATMFGVILNQQCNLEAEDYEMDKPVSITMVLGKNKSMGFGTDEEESDMYNFNAAMENIATLSTSQWLFIKHFLPDDLITICEIGRKVGGLGEIIGTGGSQELMDLLKKMDGIHDCDNCQGYDECDLDIKKPRKPEDKE